MTGREKPSMTSVNIFLSEDAREAIRSRGWTNRSAAVRHFATVLILAHDEGDDRVVPAINRVARMISARIRREMTRSHDVTWQKAIVWVPDEMMMSMDRIIKPVDLTPSQFLGATVIMACQPRDVIRAWPEADPEQDR